MVCSATLFTAPRKQAVSGVQGEKPGHSKPFPGFVPDARAACEVARAVIRPILGEDAVKHLSFSASEKNGIWTISGTTEHDPGEIAMDGRITIRIQRSDCRVLGVRLY
jgi:hypothetical protein